MRLRSTITHIRRFRHPPVLAAVFLVASLLAAGWGPLVPSALAAGPWNGHAVAFTFSSDDGNRPDNLAWAGLFTSRGLSFTVFIPSTWIGWTDYDKLTAADLQDLDAQGIEIASHGKNHVRLTEVDDIQLIDELVGSCRDIEAAIGEGYLCRTLGYPFHAHDLHVMAVVDSLGFTAARDGGVSSQGYPNFSLGVAKWSETSLFELPLVVVDSFLVGPANSHTESVTRARVLQLLSGKVTSQNYWVNVYAHTLNDIDAQHMNWILDELQNSDVWIANVAQVADYYRLGHGLPVPPGVGLGSTGIGPEGPGGRTSGRVFPNPVRNGFSSIRFRVLKSGNVTVRILDLSGRSVRTLFTGRMAAGEQTAQWDGRDGRGDRVSSGLYFYEVRTPAYRTVRKVVRLQ